MEKIKFICLFVIIAGALFGQEKLQQSQNEAAEAARSIKSVCAVTGVKIDVTDKTPYSDYQNTKYYFINIEAKRKFDLAQWKYVKDILTCNVCGNQENRKTKTFLDTKYDNRIYYVCSMQHKTVFDKDPKKYIKGTADLPQQFNYEQYEFNKDISVQILGYKYVDSVIDKNGEKKFAGKDLKFVVVDVTIKNVTEKELRMLPPTWELYDTKGYVHINQSVDRHLVFQSKPLQPEESYKTVMTFELKKDLFAAKIRSHMGKFGKIITDTNF